MNAGFKDLARDTTSDIQALAVAKNILTDSRFAEGVLNLLKAGTPLSGPMTDSVRHLMCLHGMHRDERALDQMRQETTIIAKYGIRITEHHTVSFTIPAGISPYTVVLDAYDVIVGHRSITDNPNWYFVDDATLKRWSLDSKFNTPLEFSSTFNVCSEVSLAAIEQDRLQLAPRHVVAMADQLAAAAGWVRFLNNPTKCQDGILHLNSSLGLLEIAERELSRGLWVGAVHQMVQ